ncbi:hypothetical protein [Roseomonas sp. 18066]|uniref:hypothetical protein n=1 Tax=Roseomonas sp. 18066 TaxID=2681412 RepID=UPI001358ADEB|nr:hypothetical protein [Roseomonas sp. 18066]
MSSTTPGLALGPWPLLFDPALPAAGAWLALPLALLRHLPAGADPVPDPGRLAYLSLAEQLAAPGEGPAPRMTLSRAYVPARRLPRLEGATPLQAVALRLPGCAARLLGLPRLNARVVRFGFPGARLVLADGRQGEVVATLPHRSAGRSAAALRVALEDALLELPLHGFATRVRSFDGPPGPISRPESA